MVSRNTCLLVFILFCSVVISDESKNEEKEENVFVPTHKWQVVRKGQKIPKGLHVRIDLEKGITEAKLMDEEDQDSKNNAVVEVPQEHQVTEDSKLLKTKVITEALKKIRNDDILKADDMKKMNNKFRSYEQLKKEMEDLNLTPKIDAEVLKDLFKQHKKEIKKQKINEYAVSRILEDFEFLAHQFDNALEFVKQNGFKEVIYKNLNSSNSRIKENTLKLFGSLVQNNAKVQIHALETGSIGVLLRILNLESSAQVKSRAVYALSCLLRRFPLAQLKFVENGGLSVIAKMLENDSLKIQTKLVTLMTDLIVEYKQAVEDKSNKYQNMVIQQYKLVNLEELLLEQDWCTYLSKLLYSLLAVDTDDHDSIEKCVLSMHTVANKCAVHYNKDILLGLLDRYKILALNDLNSSDDFSNSDFFRNVHDLCNDILRQSNVKTEL